MREHKYRAWFPEQKRMSEPFTIDELAEGGWYDHPKWVLMQYLGIMDKEGKEICVGDIFPGGRFNYVLEYHQESAAFIFTTDPDDINATSWRFSSRREGREKNLAILQIIGNIYENPELLCTAK